LPEQTTAQEAAGGVGDYDLLEGVQVHLITAYNVPPAKCDAGGRMSLSDQRSRIALHTNWKCQALAVLLGGLPSKRGLVSSSNSSSSSARQVDWKNRPQPDPALVAAVSP
jgi:hypothetical protein